MGRDDAERLLEKRKRTHTVQTVVDQQTEVNFFSHGATNPSEPWHPNCRGFTITLNGHTTLGRTLLDEWSAPRIYLYQTTHNTHKRQVSMPSAGLQPELPASERPQTYALERAAPGIG
jgi:hypothetical protein